ncbi:hypothetical protein [Oceanicoccus sagamiensis]|uniref:hypothetical protein n=1 Tax=Oceanicoccus sagamiensis TaxID=716816 RepID=UPI0012F483C4|nr:hypothetical protein [Oceanicoccus sagamiensis]
MTKAILVHGFNIADQGKNTISKLTPYFQERGIKVENFSYGWIGLMGVYFLNPRIVQQLINKVSPGDIGVCHSNGCVIVHMAAHQGAPFRKAVYINPALNSNASIAPHLENVDVWCNDGDLPVKFGAWLRVLVPWAPLGDPLWGDMGARGYQSNSYVESEYIPSGRVNRLIHWLNILCFKNPVLLLSLRILCAPLALAYWFILGPTEFAITYYRNNVTSNNTEINLDLSRHEDNKFFFYSLAVPIITWGLVVIATFW